MGCHGSFSLDEPTRRSWYNPEAILVDLKTGMTFADIGCGDGYFTVLAAKKVGAKGKAYAVDIDPSGLEKWSRLLPLQFKYFEKLEAEGTLEVYYHLIGQQGSMLIVNADSDEKLSKFIGQDPLFFDLEREIYPLTTRQTHERQIRELLGQR